MRIRRRRRVLLLLPRRRRRRHYRHRHHHRHPLEKGVGAPEFPSSSLLRRCAEPPEAAVAISGMDGFASGRRCLRGSKKWARRRRGTRSKRVPSSASRCVAPEEDPSRNAMVVVVVMLMLPAASGTAARGRCVEKGGVRRSPPPRQRGRRRRRRRRRRMAALKRTSQYKTEPARARVERLGARSGDGRPGLAPAPAGELVRSRRRGLQQAVDGLIHDAHAGRCRRGSAAPRITTTSRRLLLAVLEGCEPPSLNLVVLSRASLALCSFVHFFEMEPREAWVFFFFAAEHPHMHPRHNNHTRQFFFFFFFFFFWCGGGGGSSLVAC